MIRKILSLLFLINITIQAENYPNCTTIKEVFSYPAMSLSIRQQIQVHDLLDTIRNHSPYEQAQAAQEAASVLNQELVKRKQLYEESAPQDKSFIGYKAGILMVHVQHLENFAHATKQALGLGKRTTGFLKKQYNKFNAKSSPSLTQQLLDYARLEREHIFSSYPSTLALAVAHEHKDLPELMTFWRHSYKQHVLLRESKKHLYQPKIQAAALLDAGTAAAEDGLTVALDDAEEQFGAAADGATTAGNASAAEDEQLIKDSIEEKEATEALTNFSDIKSKVEEAEKILFRKDPVGFLKSFVPPVKSLEDLAAEVEAATAEGPTTEALADAENTAKQLKEYRMGAKNILRNKTQRVFGLNKQASEANLSKLTNIMNDSEPEGIVLDQINQARVAASKIMEDAPANSSLDRTMRWFRGKNSSIERNLGKLDKKLMDKTGRLWKKGGLEDSANAIAKARRAAGTFDESGTQDMLDQVKAFREQMQSPLTGSGRALKTLGNMNKALAENYPVLHMVLNMTLFMDAMMGGQLAVNWENTKQAQTYLAMTQKRNTISSNFQSEVSKIALAQKSSIRQIKANKVNMLTKMAAIHTKMDTHISQEKNYAIQAVVGKDAEHIYVSQPMMFDQTLYYSPMLTPSQSTPLFPTEAKASSPWVINPKRPLKLKQSTQGWLLAQGNAENQTGMGTGAWTIGESAAREPRPSILSQRISVPNNYPNNPIAHTWYNPFRAGNWIFNPQANAFFQYTSFPITSSSHPQGDAKSALQNSIFTEYVPPIILNKEGVQTYIVQVEMKIYNAQFPFFAGIFFNGGRWISGSQDLRTQHRLFGLYGNQQRKISLYGTETAYTTAKNQLQSTTSISALEQVFATEATRNKWGGLNSELIPNPLYPNNKDRRTPLEVGKTYILTAATQPTRMMLILEEKTEQGSVPIFGPYTIINRNPFISIYHNIGFISGGCSTGFKLLQPKQLVYSQQALEAFKKEIGLTDTTATRAA